jgi:hypothetical protein
MNFCSVSSTEVDLSILILDLEEKIGKQLQDFFLDLSMFKVLSRMTCIIKCGVKDDRYICMDILNIFLILSLLRTKNSTVT